MKKTIIILLSALLLACSPKVIETPPVESGVTETPIETPVDTPMETPLETPVDTPIETPAETPIETPVETEVETPVVDSSHLITLYYQPNSKEYQSLQGEEIKLSLTNEYTPMRLTVPQDGVTLSYQYLEYIPWLNTFRILSETNHNLEKGKIYVLDVDYRTIPEYRIVATKGDKEVVWYLTDSGESPYNVVEVEAETFVDHSFFEDSHYFTLAKAIAYQSVMRYDNNEDIENSHSAWLALASALSIYWEDELREHRSLIEGNEDYMAVETWIVETLLSAMYPKNWEKYMADPLEEYVIQVDGRHEKYDIAYLEYSSLFPIDNIEYQQRSDGSHSVKISLLNRFTEYYYTVNVVFDLVDDVNYRNLLNYEVKSVDLNVKKINS